MVKELAKSGKKNGLSIEKFLALEDQYTWEAQAFATWLKENDLALDYESLAAYYQGMIDGKILGKGDKPLASNTVNKRIAALKKRIRTIFNGSAEALDMGKAFKLEQTLRHLKPMKKAAGARVEREKCLSLEEITQIIEGAPERISLMIEFLARTACRVREMIQAKFADVKRLKRGYHPVRIVGKGKKERYVKIPPDLLKRIKNCYKSKTYLFESSEGNPYSREYITREVARVGRRVLNKVISAHTLRHTWATIQVEKYPQKIKAISLYLGHSSVAITLEMYVHQELENGEFDLEL